jgi:hypothetical protein
MAFLWVFEHDYGRRKDMMLLLQIAEVFQTNQSKNRKNTNILVYYLQGNLSIVTSPLLAYRDSAFWRNIIVIYNST